MVGTMFFLATIVVFLRPQKLLTMAHRASAAQAAPTEKDSFAFSDGNADVEQMIAEIKKEKAALAEREQKLRQLEDRLLTERAEINQVTQTVHQLQNQFDASVVRVRLEADAAVLRLAVADNGAGFDIEAAGEGGGAGNGFGLASMRQRAEKIGAQLSIRSALMDGTTVVVELPTVAAK